jgi:hypothetical protein
LTKKNCYYLSEFSQLYMFGTNENVRIFNLEGALMLNLGPQLDYNYSLYWFIQYTVQ